MALVKCKECGKEVSTSAKICPHCGVKNPGIRAKDMIIGVLTLVFIGWLVIQYSSDNEASQSEISLTVPDGLSAEVKSLVESAWPKIKAACPGLNKYANNLEFQEIYDNFRASMPGAERVSIVIKVKENSSLVVGGHVVSGHNCFFEISRDGTRLSIPKRPCASLCEDRAIDNSEYKKSI